MALTRCKVCRRVINASAGECPYCGNTRWKTLSHVLLILAGIVIFLLVAYLISPFSR